MAGISITLGGNFAVLDKLRQKVGETVAKIRDGFAERIGQRAFDGLLVAARAVGEGIKEVIDDGGRLADMMARTGAQGEGLIVLQQMFKNAGMAAEDVAPALNKMQKALAGVNEDGDPTNKAFADIGLSISELLAQDPAKAFAEVATSIAKIEDPAKRTETAMKIFGKSGASLLAVITDPTAFAEAERQVGGYASTVAGAVTTLDGVGDNLGALHYRVLQLAAAIAVKLAPALDSFAKSASSVDLTAMGSMIASIIQGMGKLLSITNDVATLWTGIDFGKAFKRTFSDPSGEVQSLMAGIRRDINPDKISSEAETKGDLSKQVEALEKKRAELQQAAEQIHASAVDSGDDDEAALVTSILKSSITELDAMKKKIESVSDAQLQANKAKHEAIKAEAEHADEMKKSAKEYDNIKKRLDDQLSRNQERAAGRGAIADQLKAAEAVLQRIHDKDFSPRLKAIADTPGMDAATAMRMIDSDPDAERRSRDTKAMTAALEAQDRLAEVKAKQAEEEEKVRKTREEATAAYASDLAILRAEIDGNSEKVRQLQKEADIREKIAQLVQAGISADEAKNRAQALANAKEASLQAGARRSADDVVADAEAEAKGADAVKERNIQRRAKELFDAGGLSKDDADKAARNEDRLQQLKELRSRADNMRVNAPVVDSMQRIGGGGGVARSLDYGRQQTDLQRQMVGLLKDIKSTRASILKN